MTLGGGYTPALIAVGVVTLAGIAAAFYLRKKKKYVLEDSTKKYSLPLIDKKEINHDTRRFRFQLPEDHVLGSLRNRFVPRELKMVFVVNRARLVSRQSVCLAVSTGCIRLFKTAQQDTDFTPRMKVWLRQGQMKVVLKTQEARELENLFNKAVQMDLPAVLLTADDKALIEEKKKESEEKETMPVLMAIIGETDKLDKVTGHLKLL